MPTPCRSACKPPRATSTPSCLPKWHTSSDQARCHQHWRHLQAKTLMLCCIAVHQAEAKGYTAIGGQMIPRCTDGLCFARPVCLSVDQERLRPANRSQELPVPAAHLSKPFFHVRLSHLPSCDVVSHLRSVSALMLKSPTVKWGSEKSP